MLQIIQAQHPERKVPEVLQQAAGLLELLNEITLL
jgi:hypothetical protein